MIICIYIIIYIHDCIYYDIIWYRYSGLSYVFIRIPSWGSPFTRRYHFFGEGIFQSVSAQQTKPRWGREHESCDITCHNQTRESQSPTKWRLGWSTNLVDDSRGIDHNKPRHRRDFHWDRPLSEQRLLAIPCYTSGALRQERLRQTYTLTAIWKALKSDIGMDWHLHQTSTVESGTFKLRIGYAEIWFSIMNPHFLRTNPSAWWCQQVSFPALLAAAENLEQELNIFPHFLNMWDPFRPTIYGNFVNCS